MVEAVAADMAGGDARLLGIFVRDLDQLLAALGVELGDRDAEELALDDRVEAEIGLADGAVDGLDRGRSQTWTESMRGSGTLTVPSWLIGMVVP